MLFDCDYYLRQYEEITNTDQKPLIHFLKIGWREGKNPSSEFNTTYYLNRYSDVRQSGLNPLVHYIRFGKEEGRAINPSQGKRYEGYKEWVRKFDTLTKSDQDKILSDIANLKIIPLVSIIILVDKNADQWVKKSIISVLSQIYMNLELIIVYDPRQQSKFPFLLCDEIQRDSRIRILPYDPKEDPSTILNKALDISSGQFFLQLNPSEILREHALYLAIKEINHFPSAEVIYTDQDRLNRHNERCHPFFKPEWNPDLFLSKNLLSNLCFYKTNTAKKVGGYQKGFGEERNWDLAMRITETIAKSNIRHIPHVSAHRRFQKKTSKPKANEYKTLKSHFDNLGKDIKLIETESPYWHIKYPIPDPNPLVSIIIPTKNQPQLLKNCLESINNKTTYLPYEILVINNQTTDPDALAYFADSREMENIYLLDYDDTFNYSAINNYAVKHTRGEILIFLNDDVEVISPDWLEELVGHAVRDEIGAVGAMLYFPNDTIQHAGIILYPDRIAGHAFYSQARGSYGQNDRARLVQNYSAVTGACMAVEKSKFLQVNGFDEENLPIAYNDVDLCLKFKQAGYENLWTPFAELYHHESVSRGLDDTKEKQTLLNKEADFMIRKWGLIIANDPAYNPNLKSHPFFSLAEPPRSIKPWKSGNPIKPSN